MKHNRILVLGYFGHVTNQIDGQTLKTRNIYSTLKRHSGSEVLSFDSQTLQKSKWNIFVLLKLLIIANRVVVIPGRNMLKGILPILFVISRMKKSKIILITIGGWLSWYIDDKPVMKYILSKIDAIFPETMMQVEELRSRHGYEHIKYFPNYRTHNFAPVITAKHTPFKLVFCARIHKLKGLDIIFSVADHFAQNGGNNIVIDFYGQINEPDRVYFESEVAKYNFVNYQGVLEQSEIYSTLSNYDVMLFPTRYLQNEGFPGSILDAYIAGIPVIASNWVHASEFIDNNNSGFICDINDIELFIAKINILRTDGEMLLRMKGQAYEISKKYSEDSAWKIIKQHVV